MKTLKKLGLVMLLLIAAVFINGVYFVFYGQFKTAEKILKKQEISRYEIASIYSMHMAICTVGWIYSPEATQEIIGMSFSKNRNTVKYVKNDFFLESPVVQKALNGLAVGKEKRIAFKDDCYSLFNPNHRVALAANPGFLKMEEDSTITFRAPLTYPMCKAHTRIFITKNFYILINESLFKHLENIHVLHPYTIVYYTRQQ